MIHRLFVACLVLLFGFSAAVYGQTPGKLYAAEFRVPSGGRVWVYVPPNAPANGKLPCVVVPPAGSRLFHGMSLGQGDQAEHIPWAMAGFIVVSFDISGPLPAEQPTKEAIVKAVTDFTKARCGIDDALAAVKAAAATYPQIDTNRLYLVGHSSAGTLVLEIAAATNQFKACVAFAPVPFVTANIGRSAVSAVNTLVPGSARTIEDLSPKVTVEKLQCPVFLFHAADDPLAPSLDAYHDMLQIVQKPVQYLVVPNGGHYDSMIKVGIPKAIAWITELDKKLLGGAAK